MSVPFCENDIEARFGGIAYEDGICRTAIAFYPFDLVWQFVRYGLRVEISGFDRAEPREYRDHSGDVQGAAQRERIRHAFPPGQ
jgi:hypothetical protein